MAAKKDTVQLNTNVRPESAEKFRKMCEERGLTHTAGMELAINAWEVDDLAERMPGRREEIDRFMGAMETATEIYKSSLKICDESREVVRKEFEAQLESDRKQLAQQSDEIDRLMAEAQTAEAEKDEALNEANAHIDRLKSDVQREAARADQAEARVAEMERQLADAATMAEMINDMRAMINHQPDSGHADDPQ